MTAPALMPIRAGTAMDLSVCSTRSRPLRIALPGSAKWNMTPSPSHFTGLRRSDAPLLHEALRHFDEVLEDRVLPVPALQPGHEALDEVGESGALLVDDPVLVGVGEVEGP